MTDPRAPTRRQLEVLAARIRTGSVKAAALELDISEQTAKNQLSDLNKRCGGLGTLNVTVVIGWLVIPADLAVRPSLRRRLAAARDALDAAMDEIGEGAA